LEKLTRDVRERLRALETAIDEYAPVFKKLRGASDLASYLAAKPDQADEEILTEPILRSIIERVLGFPKGRYLEQLSRSGKKPDFTPEDLLAHPFVLDAKSTDQSLVQHELQIQGYMTQRRLDRGVLFNLREVRVFSRGRHGADPALSFPVLPLWQVARGEAIAGEEVDRFAAFCRLFAYHEVSAAEKVRYIAEQPPWPVRFHGTESFAVDVEALVERLRRLSIALAEDAGTQFDELRDHLALNPDREQKLLGELTLLAQDIAPGTPPDRLPSSVAGWRSGEGVAAAVWRQYTLRVAYLALARILLYRAWEDVEFVKSYLHDGGFERWYDELGRRARRVLDEAFLHGGERYRWLFGSENNYAWYRPGEEAIDHQAPASFPALGVLPVDTLTSKSAPDASLELEPEHRADHAELVDDRFGLVPLDGAKRAVYRERLRPDGAFDYVVGNPPYVAEANNKPLFDRLRAIPAWKGIYRGKTDYLYYFLLLAVEKLRPGGTLAVITPAGWMNAGAADFLRRRLLEELTLERLFLFGSYRVFATTDAAPTPTVESAILIATKRAAPKRHRLRIVALEDQEAAPADRHELLEELARRADGRAGRRGGIHVHDLEQATLRADIPWPVKFGAKDVGTLVVAHLQGQLDEGRCEPLAQAWTVVRGIESGADAYSKRIDKRLSVADRSKLQQAGVTIGAPILELPPGAELGEPWASADVTVKNPESRAILYGAIDEADYTSLVVIRSAPTRDVLRALEPFKPLLETRAEIARNSRRHWWEAAWPRSDREMRAPKVIALYRTDRGRFALDETGEWQPSNKSTIVAGREPDAPVAYLCGVLNSELLDLWYAVRGKTPWHVRRNYEPLRMNEMPYRSPDGDPRCDELAELVRRIAANRRALLPHRAAVVDLVRTIKDPWRTGPVEVDQRSILRELPDFETVSVRLHDALTLVLEEPVRAKVRRLQPRLLELVRGRQVVGTLAGESHWLDLVERLLGGVADESLPELLLPKDPALFARRCAERKHLVEGLLREGRELVERVERLVCAVYDVPDDLTEAVVEHAVRRAG
jgi:hypothetical protein